MSAVTTAREFAVRRLAMQRITAAGLPHCARKAQHLAAQLHAAGRSVDAAARIATAKVAETAGGAA